MAITKVNQIKEMLYIDLESGRIWAHQKELCRNLKRSSSKLLEEPCWTDKNGDLYDIIRLRKIYMDPKSVVLNTQLGDVRANLFWSIPAFSKHKKVGPQSINNRLLNCDDSVIQRWWLLDWGYGFIDDDGEVCITSDTSLVKTSQRHDKWIVSDNDLKKFLMLYNFALEAESNPKNTSGPLAISYGHLHWWHFTGMIFDIHECLYNYRDYCKK